MFDLIQQAIWNGIEVRIFMAGVNKQYVLEKGRRVAEFAVYTDSRESDVMVLFTKAIKKILNEEVGKG